MQNILFVNRWTMVRDKCCLNQVTLLVHSQPLHASHEMRHSDLELFWQCVLEMLLILKWVWKVTASFRPSFVLTPSWEFALKCIVASFASPIADLSPEGWNLTLLLGRVGWPHPSHVSNSKRWFSVITNCYQPLIWMIEIRLESRFSDSTLV